jgi:DNA-binding winged helix-turn-helix (wHTH) protein
MAALGGLLRLSSEALDEKSIKKWDLELDRLVRDIPGQVPPSVWYCKGVVARYHNEFILAQRFFHRYLRSLRTEPTDPNQAAAIARAWIMLATVSMQRGHLRRAQYLAKEILKRYGRKNHRGIEGITYLLLGSLALREKDFQNALKHYQKAHVKFLGEHNWFYHLYALFGYARVARMQNNTSQATWYLNLIEQAALAPEFGILRQEIEKERRKLEQDSVDLLVDSRKGIVATKETGELSLRKQFVLLHILEALSEAHEDPKKGSKKGLSKAEIIKRVWKQNYVPETHDNKLYYNINRLRKLIEPDLRKPRYLLNWEQGYRLAPGLRVQLQKDDSKTKRGI